MTYNLPFLSWKSSFYVSKKCSDPWYISKKGGVQSPKQVQLYPVWAWWGRRRQGPPYLVCAGGNKPENAAGAEALALGDIFHSFLLFDTGSVSCRQGLKSLKLLGTSSYPLPQPPKQETGKLRVVPSYLAEAGFFLSMEVFCVSSATDSCWQPLARV